MSPGEIVRTALGEVRGHKLRSALTLLGIVLGTLSITVMTSFLGGIAATVWSGFDNLGYDGVIYVMNRDPRDPREAEIFQRSRGLQPGDAAALVERGIEVEAVAPAIYAEGLIRRGATERNARVMGVDPTFARVRKRQPAEGRFITDSDERAFARVCVLGHRLKLRLFGSEDPLGKNVEVDGRPFQVVGVGKDLANMFVHDDEFVEEMEGLYVPLATHRKFFSGDEAPVTFLAVRGFHPDRLGDLQAEVEASLKIAHRGAEDFRVANIAQEIVKARAQVTKLLHNWNIVLGTIAGISLTVGGIGLLSVMLIAIGERLYEIGLRKAIGASDLEVFLQFLFEAVVLSVVGGLLGTLLGVIIVKAASAYFPSGLPIDLAGCVYSIGVAVALGALFGVYPALKASRMPPVEALRASA